LCRLQPHHHLQASTNTLLAHFLSVVFANTIIGLLNNAKGRPATA
jgi:hypothetical protein